MTNTPTEAQLAQALAHVRGAEGLIILLEDFGLTEEQRLCVKTITRALRTARELMRDRDLPPPASSTSVHHILVVDDDAVQRVWASRTLEKAGFLVSCAATGPEALLASRQREWSLIIMDCEIPEVDGFEVVNLIRTRRDDPNQATPILAYTSYCITGYRERCYQVGMDAFLQKPASREQLVAAVSGLIGIEQKSC